MPNALSAYYYSLSSSRFLNTIAIKNRIITPIVNEKTCIDWTNPTNVRIIRIAIKEINSICKTRLGFDINIKNATKTLRDKNKTSRNVSSPTIVRIIAIAAKEIDSISTTIFSIEILRFLSSARCILSFQLNYVPP